MKKKIGIIALAIGWVIFAGFLLYSYGYKPHIARHRAEALDQGVRQGVEATRNVILQEIMTRGSLQITINGETKILKPVTEEKKKKKWW